MSQTLTYRPEACGGLSGFYALFTGEIREPIIHIDL